MNTLSKEDLAKISEMIEAGLKPIKEDITEMKKDIEEIQDNLGLNDVDVDKLKQALARGRKYNKLDR